MDAKWIGKKVFDEAARSLESSRAAPAPARSTGRRSVRSHADRPRRKNLIHFWLGEQGYGPLLANLRRGRRAHVKARL